MELNIKLPENDPISTMRPFIDRLRFIPQNPKPGEQNIIFQSTELRFPVTQYYADLEHAESMTQDLKVVYQEAFDRLETMAMELPRAIGMEFSENWKNAPDMISQMWLKYATGEEWKPLLGTEEPSVEKGFGEKAIFIVMTVGVVRTPDFDYVSFAAWATPGTQRKENLYQYDTGEALETIY